jgi:hypothetical protein
MNDQKPEVSMEDLSGDYSEHSNYPSRYAIGDIVLFQPNLSKIKYVKPPKGSREMGRYETDDTAIVAQIVAIKFTASKVLYDLAVSCTEPGEFYNAKPLCNVDSFMVLDADTGTERDNDEQASQ